MAGKKGKKGGGGGQTEPQQPPNQSSDPQPGPSAAPQPTTTQQDSQASSSQGVTRSKKSQKGAAKAAQDESPSQVPQTSAPVPAPAPTPAPTPAPAPTTAEDTAEPSESGGAAKKKKKKKKKSAQDKDEATEPSDAVSTPAPAQAGPSTSGQQATTALSGDFKKMSVTDAKCKYEIPGKRTPPVHSLNSCMKAATIETNYLSITIQKWNQEIFHYDVTFNPDKPKYLYRNALHILLRRLFPGRHPGFDGKKNLYAAGTHLFKTDSIRDSVELPDTENGNRMKTFDITVKKTPQSINMAQLKRYMDEGKSQEIPQDVIQATDIALRSGLYNRFIPCSRSFFSGPMPESVPLGDGMELYDGFFQSAIAGQKNFFLNVDVSNKAFPYDQPVLNYMRTQLRIQDFSGELTAYAKRDLEKYLKGLKILYEVQGDRRTYRVNNIGSNTALSHKFQPEGKRMMSVAEYFQTVKRIPIRYPNLPLLHVGPPAKNTMVPIEFCRVIGRQVVNRKLDDRQTSMMVKAAAKPTDERKSRIERSILNADYKSNEVLNKEFGISVNTQFHRVKSWVFKPPVIVYKEKPVHPNNGEWKMDRERFLVPGPNGIKKWAVLIKDRQVHAGILTNPSSGLVPLLINGGRGMGIDMAPPCELYQSNDLKNQNQRAIEGELTMLKNKHDGLQIVIVILFGGPPGNQDVKNCYGNVKRASELRCGVLTQCLKSDTVLKKMNNMTAFNILLKMNAKVNGVNHGIGGPMKSFIFTKPVMFVGADVTHPAPGSDDSPSIAAVAASFDIHCFKYKIRYGLQSSRQEMIVDLEAMMVHLLKHFQSGLKSGKLPERIFYYRDGVSEGQFSQVLDVELEALKRAVNSLRGNNAPPLITFLVVQKRHHTRFFPSKKDGDGSKNNNVLPGTVVDTDITHPTEMDFFLVSHKSIQGTARPTKYHVLHDENNLGFEELEILTYYLCYMFARCNRSVSYPAPTYYAHLAAFRARAWWDGQNPDAENLMADQERRGTIHPAIANGNPMFFV